MKGAGAAAALAFAAGSLGVEMVMARGARHDLALAGDTEALQE